MQLPADCISVDKLHFRVEQFLVEKFFLEPENFFETH